MDICVQTDKADLYLATSDWCANTTLYRLPREQIADIEELEPILSFKGSYRASQVITQHKSNSVLLMDFFNTEVRLYTWIPAQIFTPYPQG